MVTCEVCKLEIQEDECTCSHSHIPDFFLSVWNCNYCLKRIIHKKDGSSTEEMLPFNLPKKVAFWVIEDTCGSSINRSGIYRLPGIVWEYVLLKMRGDKEADFLLKQIINQINEKRR